MRFLKDIFKEYVSKIKPHQWLIGLLSAVVLVWVAIFSWPKEVLLIRFFDVGQGDSIFIQTPKGYQILIDGGPDKTVLTRLEEVLPYYDRNLDLLILTHPHADHVTGLIEVLKRYKVDRILVNRVPYASPEYEEFWRLVTKLNIPRGQFLQGQKIFLNDGIMLTSFWPQRQMSLFEVTDVNRVSMVMRLEYGKFSVLFTGDTEFGEVYELSEYPWTEVEILKVPHQGSKDALTKEVLQKLKPELAIISVGPNRFGHPHQEILDFLQQLQIELFRTDRNGTISVISNGQNWQVE